MISVLVVDDSALVRSMLSEIINDHPLLTLVGTAPDAYVAKRMVNEFKPDVITLDIEMPKVSGLVFLDRLMKARPTPVVMFSSLTEYGAAATIEALELGAVDFIAKPKLNIANKVSSFSDELTEKILQASQVRIDKRPNLQTSAELPLVKYTGNNLIIALGASTGGTEAIRKVLVDLPARFPAIVISQHMPAGFTASFARRLDKLCKVHVKEAEQDEQVTAGNVYIAPGDYHLELVRSADGYRISLSQAEKVNNHRPSVDVMFASVAKQLGANAAGVILTGMGKDGAVGLKAMQASGAQTMAQSKESCVIFGMPKEAIKCDAVNETLDISEISSALANWVGRKA